MPKKPLDVETLWQLPRTGAPLPSPDGRLVLLPVTTYDMNANEGTTRLWLVPADAREAGAGHRDDPARPLTTADASSGQPAWSPDGTRIVFTRKPGGTKGEAKGAGKGKKKRGPKHPDVGQLYLMRLDGGEPERLTDFPFGVADPQWFPDGRRIAFLSEVYEDAPDLEDTARRKEEKNEDPVKAHVTEDRFYRYWDAWLTERRFPHVFVLDLETRKVVDLTPTCSRILPKGSSSGAFCIAPDGREVAFTGLTSEPPYDDLLDGVFTFRVPARVRKAGKAPRIRQVGRGQAAKAFFPAYSPDGRWLVYGIQHQPDFYADRVRLVALERETGETRVLTENWDSSPSAWRFGDDSKTLHLLSEVDGRGAIHRLDLEVAWESADGAAPEEVARGGTFSTLRVAGGRLFASLSSLREPPEAYVIEANGGEPRRLTAFTKKGMKGVQRSRVEEIWFEGAEGHQVQMFLLLPPGERLPARKAQAKKTWPLVQLVHGGPHGTFGDVWHWRWNSQVFASPGYAVACVNFHGSTSFGEAFTSSILGRWGDQPYEDVMAATDTLLQLGIVKKSRMAIAGGSYGGYLASWIASQTDRFACIVNHAGVSDFQTQYASDITHGRARSMGGEPWVDLEGMDRYNPMRHAAGFRSPMLVIHGVGDYRVPSDQGLSIYGVYKAMKRPARLVVFPDETHWVLKPQNSRRWYGEVLGWFERWLGTSRRARYVRP